MSELPITSFAIAFTIISALLAVTSEFKISERTVLFITPVIIAPPAATPPAPLAEPVRPTILKVSSEVTMTPLSLFAAFATVVETVEFEIPAVTLSEETIVFTAPVIAAIPAPAPPTTVASIVFPASASTVIFPVELNVVFLISAFDCFEETKVFTPPFTAASPEPLA